MPPTTTASTPTSPHSPNQAHTTAKATLALTNTQANTQAHTQRTAPRRPMSRYSRSSPALYPCPIWAPTPADRLSPVGRPWAIADPLFRFVGREPEGRWRWYPRSRESHLSPRSSRQLGNQQDQDGQDSQDSPDGQGAQSEQESDEDED